MNECRPPSPAIRSSPGRRWRWYVLPSRIVVPSARSSSGCTPFTVPFVPTGMNAGVGTSPCAVRSTPARAAPSVAVTSKLLTGSASHHRTSRSGSARRSQARRADREHALGVPDPLPRLGPHVVPLAVELVRVEVGDVHGPERVEPDVQRDALDVEPSEEL